MTFPSILESYAAGAIVDMNKKIMAASRRSKVILGS
jgi:hypothetical protein